MRFERPWVVVRNLTQFIDQLPAAVCRVTIEGSIVYCNRAFSRLFGYESPSEMIEVPVVNLYRNKKDRGHLVQAVLHRGQVCDTPVAFRTRNDVLIWCAVTAKAVFDDDGVAVFIDALLKDITGEIEDSIADLYGSAARATEQQAVFNIDVQGRFIDCNTRGIDLLGIPEGELDGKAFIEFLPLSEHDFFLMLMGDIRKLGREEAILRLRDAHGVHRLVELTAILVRTDGRAHHVKMTVKDVTDRIKLAEASRITEKFQGVLEMAGGVAHRLNQPLTVVTNIINEMLTQMGPTDRFYTSAKKAHAQIMRLNEITGKIGNIKKYAAIDYVAGVKIVDIDQAS